MRIQNYKYICAIIDSTPVILYGLQDYSPGQSKRCDVWVFEVPAEHQENLADKTECLSFGEAVSTLAISFFDGDIAKAEASMCVIDKS